MSEDQNIFSVVPIEVALDHRLTLRHVRVLVALFSFRSKTTNTVWPKRETLADRCGFPLTRISTITTELARLGWLEKVGAGGKGAPSHYKLTVPTLVTVTKIETVTDSDTKTVTDSVTQTVTSLDTRKEVSSEVSKEESSLVELDREKPVRLIFDYWRETMRHPRAVLDDKRRRAISARLKHYSVEDIKRAIDGCKASDWHQGNNPNGTKHDDIELICRDAKRVEGFMAKLEDRQRPAPAGGERIFG